MGVQLFPRHKANRLLVPAAWGCLSLPAEEAHMILFYQWSFSNRWQCRPLPLQEAAGTLSDVAEVVTLTDKGTTLSHYHYILPLVCRDIDSKAAVDETKAMMKEAPGGRRKAADSCLILLACLLSWRTNDKMELRWEHRQDLDLLWATKHPPTFRLLIHKNRLLVKYV